MSRQTALLVVRGSNGSGKTTLLAEWARQQPGTVVWLNIGAHTSDPVPFWQAVLQGLRDARLAEPGAPLHSGGELPGSGRDHLRRVQAGLRALEAPVALAVDGAESLSAQAAEELLAVLAVAPALVVGVATRERGAFELPAVRLAVDTVVVAGAELEFTAAETAAVLSAAGLPDDAETVRLVRGASLGHPRSTRALLSAPSWPDLPNAEELDRHLLAAADGADIRLLELAAEDGALLELALHASVVDELPLGLAEVLAGQRCAARAADAAELLDRAESLGLGYWTSDVPARGFRFTAPVRGILRRELGERGVAELGAARRTAIGWLLDSNRAEAAFLLAVQSGEYELASEAGAQCFLALLASRAEELRAVLSPIPVETMRSQPILAMLLAVSYNQVARLRPRALEYFAIVVLGAKAVRAELGVTETIALDAMVSVALRVTAQTARAARAAESALGGFAALDDEGREQLGHLRADVMVHAGLSLLYGGAPDAALAAFQRCREPLTSAGSLHGLSVQAGTHALMGEMAEAAAVVAEGRTRRWPRGWDGGYIGSFYELAQTLLAIEALEFEAAQAHIDAVDESMATLEHWAFFAEAQARLDLISGAAVAGITRLHVARHRRRGRADLDARGRTELDIAASTLHLAAGDILAAESALPGVKRPGPALLLAQARLELVRDAPDAALALLAKAGRASTTLRLQAELSALKCAVRLRLGRPDEARDALEGLAATLDASGLVTPLALLPAEDLRDLRALAETGCSALVVRVLAQPVPAVLRRIPVISLSERERVVLRELVATSSIPAIAEALFVSVNTVKSQVRSLYRKLDVGSREEALVVAAAQRLFDGPDAG
ncbi:LuxR C-terminal-related transcriptional regulator [Microterricola viridarii]|uniref:LuxR C-terminal-related transcriptional regulator n=1 Tax=Microterricola viridarii TaxID=412690 RepID=UPI0009F36D97|nr:LuxR C-terminal-related transcriptional regulator [Microterricola viridarii]